MKRALSFEEVRRAIPEATGDLLAAVAVQAAGLGLHVHLVGGPVRDLLLGRELADVDVMVEGDALAVARAVADASARSRGRTGKPLEVVVHDRFGTVTLTSEDASIDLASLRHERYAHAGALPDVEPGSFEQDSRRRDFAVNALYCPLDATDPTSPQAIIDLEGGLEDLAQKRLRILHPRSFHDDPTRAWRAARLAVRLGFRLDRSARASLRSALRDGAFGAVSGERFRRELQLAVDEAHQGVNVAKVLRLLADWHVLAALEPGLVLGRDRQVPLRRLSRALAEPDWPAPKWRGWVAVLSIWLAPLPAALRRSTLERFSVRGEQAARIVGFGRQADRTLKALARSRGRGAVDAALSGLTEETVQGLYALADTAVRRRILRWGAEDRRRRAPVSGAELVELGLQGSDVGRALERIRAGFLDGDIANREEALALAQEIARRSAARNRRGGVRSKKSPRKKRATTRPASKSRKAADRAPDRVRGKVAAPDPITDTPPDAGGGSARKSD